MVLFIVLLFFGSKRIPSLARSMGKGIRQFKDATSDIQRDIQDSAREIKKDVDIKKDFDIKKDLED